MEQQAQQNEVFTKANQTHAGVFLNPSDAEEYRLYKKRKKLTEISSAISRSVSTLLGNEDVQRVCERAARLRQASVKLPLSKLSQAAFHLAGSGVKLDCVVGGTGETLTKVKAYETRMAVRRHANEITLVIAPSQVDSCRYGEIKREMRRVVRAAGRAGVKVRVDKAYTPTVLARLARLCGESGAKYFSVPYFEGCERLRMDLTNGCQLEVSGVENTADFRKLTQAGVGHVVTAHAWEIYSEWLKEVNELAVPAAETKTPVSESSKNELPKPLPAPLSKPAVSVTLTPASASVSTAKPLAPTALAGEKNPETNYRCRLEGNSLKFF